MPKHKHIEDLEALSIGERVLEGNCDTIVACDTCRQKITEIIEDDPSGNPEKIKWMKLMVNQMEMTAFFYKKELERILNGKNATATPEFQRHLCKVFGARKVIGEENKSADIVVDDEARRTPLERPSPFRKEV